jgi:hypothetical protein
MSIDDDLVKLLGDVHSAWLNGKSLLRNLIDKEKAA